MREGFFKPLWIEHIPVTYKDFKDKEENWPGFIYALKQIGLDSNEVKKRLMEGKSQWKNEEEQRKRCQKAYQDYQRKLPKISQERTAQAKSKLTKPESTWRKDLEHRKSVSLKASSSRQRSDEQEESENEFWKETETRPAGDRFGQRPRVKVIEEGPKRFISNLEKKTKIQLKEKR